ncbi:hypothetical protein DVR12_26845 [Chitinophaga silvatica]|uniref:Vitamin K epoxide reductase domain-containing protein n=1 Tax=Chitinophaga silvatica TaxID=2282649 RepID=A0A3E1Y2A5_9BACT|nr:vitamin K epoxide reductase family protein [Chitinophaga silvatica]RFS18819.1 hypothetical protein DVR12_26845 [Chitinophaga silvatica]
MLPLLTTLFIPKIDEAEITWQLSNELGTRVSYTAIKNKITDHPYFPTMLSISDVLHSFRIDNVTAVFDKEQLLHIPTPFITLIRGKSTSQKRFAVVKKVNHAIVEYFNVEIRKWETEAYGEFIKRFDGIAMVPEAMSEAGEATYELNIRKEKKARLSKYLLVSLLPLVLLLSGFTSIFIQGLSALLPFLFTSCMLLGLLVSILLLMYEIDKYNPAIKQICSTGNKVSCSAVLSSKGAKFLGISWSKIGFTYFFGSLFLLLVGGLTNPNVLTVLSWLSLSALSYIVYSVYYQWKVARQWCALCLSIQFVLLAAGIIALIGSWINSEIPSIEWPVLFWQLVAAYTFPVIIVYLLIPALKNAREARETKLELQRLKHDPQIFKAQLLQQSRLEEVATGLGISMGNPDAAHKIIKVCNPYCGPCAMAHQPLEELLSANPDLQVQIIFTATNNEQDIKSYPVKHLMAIAAQYPEETVKRALDDWYMPEKKDYALFAAKYPIAEEILFAQGFKLETMSDWCKRINIEFTPTFYIDGYQLPSMYSIEDLSYYLNS